ncbi:MAG: hypothetical protein WAL47_12515, partial [Pyrinomonadaceae bacterium]
MSLIARKHVSKTKYKAQSSKLRITQFQNPNVYEHIQGALSNDKEIFHPAAAGIVCRQRLVLRGHDQV